MPGSTNRYSGKENRMKQMRVAKGRRRLYREGTVLKKECEHRDVEQKEKQCK
jgi:hypothetical protein